MRALLQTGIDTHIGVAGTWATAATASARVGRSGVLHPPDHRAVEGFLGPLPIDALHGIGPVRAQQLRAYGLHTIAALAAMDATAQRSKRLPQPSAHTEDLRTGTLRLLDAMAFQRARTRRLTLIAEDLRPADEGPGTQLSLDQARENRLRLEPVGDRINAATAAASQDPPAPTDSPADLAKPVSPEHGVDAVRGGGLTGPRRASASAVAGP
ncbi:hypothetical protein [Streptomyces sp. NPDC056524]|uniref:DinB/UmuC family translesion DNA polymerase n=1 Tax=Streptomyces sp. NPDC056524 TaxID=3345851 RepID=UPI0036762231